MGQRNSNEEAEAHATLSARVGPGWWLLIHQGKVIGYGESYPMLALCVGPRRKWPDGAVAVTVGRVMHKDDEAEGGV